MTEWARIGEVSAQAPLLPLTPGVEANLVLNSFRCLLLWPCQFAKILFRKFYMLGFPNVVCFLSSFFILQATIYTILMGILIGSQTCFFFFKHDEEPTNLTKIA